MSTQPVTSRRPPARGRATAQQSWLVDVVCALVFVSVFVGVLLATWKRWTICGFPLDAGREFIVPRLIAQGRDLYTDIRCFYGPLGYWLNGAILWLFGTNLEVDWWMNLSRFAVMLALLWALARRVIGPVLSVLALSAFVFSYFTSFVAPYTTSYAWGSLFMVAGLLCATRQLGGGSLPWSVASAALFSLAATTKHECALGSAAILLVLLVDLIWRHDKLRARVRAVAWFLVGATVPFGIVGAVLLSYVPLDVLINDNLWKAHLFDQGGGVLGYALTSPNSIGTPWQAVLMIEWTGLMVAGVAAISLLLNGVRSSAAVRESQITSRRKWLLWTLVCCGLIVAGLAEWYARWSGVQCGLISMLHWPKSRIRDLVETAPVLCVPLSFLLVIAAAGSGLSRKLRARWQELQVGDQLGVLCVIGYVVFLCREMPLLIDHTRHPFTAIVLAWLLCRFLPRWLGWPIFARRAWTVGVGVLLLAGTVCALDTIVFYARLPSTFLADGRSEMYVYRRRKPFDLKWYEDAVSTLRTHRERIGEGGVACVPEGAWLNALLDLNWPTRDTQWVRFCGGWVIEDLERTPPEFIYLMEPQDGKACYPLSAGIMAVIDRDYVPVETNTSGMTLYEHRKTMTRGALSPHQGG